MKLTIVATCNSQDEFRNTEIYVYKGHLSFNDALQKVWEEFEGETTEEDRQFQNAEEMFKEVNAVINHIDTRDLTKITPIYE